MNKKRKNRLIKILNIFKNEASLEIERFSENLGVSISTIQKDIFLLKKYLPIKFKDDYIADLDYDLKSKLKDLEQIALWLINEEDPYYQFQLKNLKKTIYDIKYLPNKNSLEYTQIKNFKDYELTYCIVHEMIVRNKKVMKLLKVFHKLLTLQDKKYEEYINFKNCYDKENIYKNDKYYKKYINNFNECKEIKKEVEEKIYRRKSLINKIENILKDDYMISPFDGHFSNDYYYYGKKYLTHNYNETSDVERNFVNIVNHKYKLNTNEFDQLEGSIFNGNIEREGFVLRQAIYKGEKKFEYSLIEPNFSRNINDNNLTNISINLSLPKDELLAYISQIKDTLYPDKIKSKKLMTPEELQRDQIYEKDFVNLNKETIVDHFFVYDFVNACRLYLKKHNKMTIKDAKEEKVKRLLDDYEDFIVDDIFSHEILKSKIHLDRETVKNYYYKMYNFIEKHKYKELVDSAFVKPKIKKDGRYLSKDEQQQKRNHVFTIFNSINKNDLFDKDKTNIKKIANEAGVSQSRVYAWRKVYNKLKKSTENPEHKIDVRGRPKTINLDKTKFLDDLQSCEQIWDKVKIQSLLQSKDINMSISSINNYLKELGLIFKDDIFVNRIDGIFGDKIKLKSIKQWIDWYFPGLSEEAKENNAIIYWTDANSDKSIPLSKEKNIHIKNLISYPYNKHMFAIYSNNTINELLNFLDRLVRDTNKKIYLIIDNFNKNEYPEILTFEEKNSHKIQIL